MNHCNNEQRFGEICPGDAISIFHQGCLMVQVFFLFSFSAFFFHFLSFSPPPPHFSRFSLVLLLFIVCLQSLILSKSFSLGSVNFQFKHIIFFYSLVYFFSLLHHHVLSLLSTLLPSNSLYSFLLLLLLFLLMVLLLPLDFPPQLDTVH